MRSSKGTQAMTTATKNITLQRARVLLDKHKGNNAKIWTLSVRYNNVWSIMVVWKSKHRLKCYSILHHTSHLYFYQTLTHSQKCSHHSYTKRHLNDKLHHYYNLEWYNAALHTRQGAVHILICCVLFTVYVVYCNMQYTTNLPRCQS